MPANTALTDVEMAAEIRVQLADVTEYLLELRTRGYTVVINPTTTTVVDGQTQVTDNPSLSISKVITL